MSEDDFQKSLDKCNTESERSALITDTLNGLYSDAADKYKENNKSIIEARNATSDYTDSVAELGDKIEPITTKVKEGFNKIIEKVLELTEDIDFEAFSGKVDEAFDTFIDDVLPKVLDGLTWIKDNGDVVISLLSGIAAGFAAFKVASLIMGVVNAVKAFQLANEGATIAQALLNTTMLASPITWIVAGVAAVVAAIVLLIKNWDKVKEAGAAAWEWIKKTWEKASTWFSEKVVQPIKNFFSGLWESLITKASEAWQKVKDTFRGVADFFGGIWNKIKEKFTTIGTKVAEAIGGAFKAAINSVIRTVENSINFIPNNINKALHLINKLPNVNIPEMPTISLPRLAKGGVVSQATTAIVGEDGQEAIVPLEKNTEWIDKVAEKISAKQSVVVNQTNNYAQAHTRYELYKSRVQTEAAVRLALQGV